MEEKKLIKKVVSMMCMIAIFISSIFIIANAKSTYALDSIYAIRYHESTCNAYYITTCNSTTCNYSKINGNSWSGTIARNSLHKSKCTNPTAYTVYFNLDFGSGYIEPKVVAKNGRVSKPTSPTKSGYKFICWTLNGEEYNFSNTVKSDITLVAKWKKIEKYTVTFNSNGGSSVSTQIVEKGEKIREYTPTRSGYTFLGWYTSSGTKYNFNSQVNSSFTLYAKWQENKKPTPTPTPTPTTKPKPTPTPTPTPSQTPIPTQKPTTPSVTYYKVTFDLNGGIGNIENKSIEKNSKVSKPDVTPQKDNSIFNGWYTSKECKTVFNFDTKIAKDTTIYACYTNSYNVSIIKSGLPFALAETKKYKEGSTMQEYNQNHTLTLFDITTYEMIDKDNCVNYLSDIRKKDTAEEKCNNIEKTLKCTSDNCYNGKYLILDETNSEEIIYLKKNGIIKIEYEVYNYNGLFRDKNCEDKYSYSNKVSSNLEVYACYTKEGEEGPSNIDKPKKSKGISITLVLIILAILAVAAVVYYYIRKAKIANSVD